MWTSLPLAARDNRTGGEDKNKKTIFLQERDKRWLQCYHPLLPLYNSYVFSKKGERSVSGRFQKVEFKVRMWHMLCFCEIWDSFPLCSFWKQPEGKSNLHYLFWESSDTWWLYFWTFDIEFGQKTLTLCIFWWHQSNNASGSNKQLYSKISHKNQPSNHWTNRTNVWEYQKYMRSSMSPSPLWYMKRWQPWSDISIKSVRVVVKTITEKVNTQVHLQ